MASDDYEPTRDEIERAMRIVKAQRAGRRYQPPAPSEDVLALMHDETHPPGYEEAGEPTELHEAAVLVSPHDRAKVIREIARRLETNDPENPNRSRR